jgi:two-component SAPR family response regulator
MNKGKPTFKAKNQPTSQSAAENWPTFALYLLGTVQLCTPSGSLLKANCWANDRQLTLFIYLVLNRDHVVTPTEIQHQFWPYLPLDEVDGEVNAVCQILSHRLHLSNPIVRLQRGYQLQEHLSFWLDVDQFDRLLTQAANEPKPAQKTMLLLQAVALYRDDFLFNLPLKQKWITSWRAHFQQGYLVALQTLSTLYEQAGNLEAAQKICLNVLKTGSVSEEYGRSVIDFVDIHNTPNITLRQCKRLIALLQNELELLQEAYDPPLASSDSTANLPQQERGKINA